VHLVSQSPFGSKRWEEWLDCRSKALYYADLKDETTAKYYDTKARGLFKEWLAELRAGRILAFYNGRLEEMSGCESVCGYLDELVHKVFPFGPEQISRTYTLYDSTWGKVGAEIGLEVSRTVQRPYKEVVDTLVAQGVWEKTGQKQRPGHPLCQMKRVVDKVFDGADCVSLKELWETLQQPPYGLMPSAIGILVFSALLRPYSQGYYYSDNVNSLPLNPNKLAELVVRTLKGMKYSETYTIRRMSPQAERFCEIARSVFSLPPEQSKYPEEVRKQLRKRISDMGVPLWAAGYYQPQSLSLYSAEAVRKATGALRPLLLFGQDELTDEQMECISEALEPVRGELPRRLSRQSMESGMKQFIKEKAPRLLPLASALGLDLGTVLLRIRSLLNEETYLWQEERVEQKLPEVVNGLDLTDAINRICGTQSKDLESARVQFRASWFRGKFPLPLYAEGQPEDLADAIIYLDEIVYHPERGIIENRADDIRRLKDRLTYVLSDDLVVVKRLIHEITGEDAPIEDASSVHSSLPRLTDATRDGIRQAVLLALSAQTRQRKIADTRRLWKAITGSDTPEGWTAISKIPYQWVLEGRALDTAERLSKPSTLTEAQLDELLDYLESRPEELVVLGDPEECLHRFVRVVGGDYAKLVYEAQGSSSLHEYVASNMEGTVSSWVLRLHEVNRVARRWVTENYHATAYPTIVRKVDSLPAEDTRSLLKELASDAIVGSRLLAAMEDQHKT
jgi:hypothetical protein